MEKRLNSSGNVAFKQSPLIAFKCRRYVRSMFQNINIDKLFDSGEPECELAHEIRKNLYTPIGTIDPIGYDTK